MADDGYKFPFVNFQGDMVYSADALLPNGVAFHNIFHDYLAHGIILP
jgi:hypothetical protein